MVPGVGCVHVPSEENVPSFAGEALNATAPVGVLGVPGDVSETVAVQMVETPVLRLLGVHDTTVDVVPTTVSDALSVDDMWTLSPWYPAVIVWSPGDDGEYVVSQLAVPVVLVDESLQLPTPGPKFTVPVGVLGVPEEVSDTVAVQVVKVPAVKLLGSHATDAEVIRPTPQVKVALPLGPAESNAYTVTVHVPGAVGVPEISPAAEIDRPDGSSDAMYVTVFEVSLLAI